MIRIPEPELMESKDQASAYASADFTESNNIFLENLFELTNIDDDTKILDIGCGDGEIPIKIFKKQQCDITAIDGSQSMLSEFHKKLDINNISRIRTIKCLLNDKLLFNKQFDIVMSNSLIHHIKDIDLFWHNLIRLMNKDGTILCMDLLRPDNEDALKKILAQYGGSNQILKKDFENSLRAAYTINEINTQLSKINKIAFSIKSVSDRHFFVSIKLNDDPILKTQ